MRIRPPQWVLLGLIRSETLAGTITRAEPDTAGSTVGCPS